MLTEEDIDSALAEPKKAVGETYDGIKGGTWNAIEAILEAAKNGDKSPDFGEIAARLYPHISRRYQTHRLLKLLRSRRVRSRLIAELILIDRGDVAEKVLRISATCAVSDGLSSKSATAGRKFRAGMMALGSLKAKVPTGIVTKSVTPPVSTGPRPERSTSSDVPRLLEGAFSAVAKTTKST